MITPPTPRQSRRGFLNENAIDPQGSYSARLQGINDVALWRAGLLKAWQLNAVTLGVVRWAALPHPGRFAVCPVALPDKLRDDATLQTGRRAVRVGRLGEDGVTWVHVYADLHCRGAMLPVRLHDWRMVASHVSEVSVSAADTVTWPADIAVDHNGDSIVTEACA